MTYWRFYPLAEHTEYGLLIENGHPRPARFLTPEQAKAERPRQIEGKAA